MEWYVSGLHSQINMLLLGTLPAYPFSTSFHSSFQFQPILKFVLISMSRLTVQDLICHPALYLDG